MIHERMMNIAPSGRLRRPSGKALKASKPRMLILLVICIHDKALCIQLTNVQISFTELKSSLKTPSLRSGNQDLQMIKIIKSKAPYYVRGVKILVDFKIKSKSPSLRSGNQDLQMIIPPSGQFSRAPSLRSGNQDFQMIKTFKGVKTFKACITLSFISSYSVCRLFPTSASSIV